MRGPRKGDSVAWILVPGRLSASWSVACIRWSS